MKTAVALSTAQREAFTLIQTDLPVPPDLELSLGYKGPLRWPAIWYTPNDIACSDGLATDWSAWLTGWKAYAMHANIAPRLHALRQAGYALYPAGDSCLPESAFLLDRRDRILFLGTTQDVEELLKSQVVPNQFYRYKEPHAENPVDTTTGITEATAAGMATDIELLRNFPTAVIGEPSDASDSVALQKIITNMEHGCSRTLEPSSDRFVVVVWAY